jgi:hypothetical protein
MPGLAAWSGIRSFADLDEVGPVQRFGGSQVVAIAHPSYRHLNIHHRRFSSFTGHEAELAMVRATADPE